MVEQQQHQRQRVMTVFGKQNSAEALEKLNNLTARSLAPSVTDRKVDETLTHPEVYPSPISKLHPIHPDNYPVNLIARYDSSTLSQLTSINKIPTLVRSFSFLLLIHLSFF